MGKKKKAKMTLDQHLSSDRKAMQESFLNWDVVATPTPRPFRHIVPYVATSPTSKAAATEIKKKGPELRERVYEMIKMSDNWANVAGVTDEQIAQFTGLNPSTARPRRVELVKAGRVVQVGEGKTSSGRKAALWGIAQ